LSIDRGLRALAWGRPGDPLEFLNARVVDQRFDHAEDDAVQCRRERDADPALVRINRLRNLTLPCDDPPNPREGLAGQQSGDHAGDHRDWLVQGLDGCPIQEPGHPVLFGWVSHDAIIEPVTVGVQSSLGHRTHT